MSIRGANMRCQRVSVPLLLRPVFRRYATHRIRVTSAPMAHQGRERQVSDRRRQPPYPEARRKARGERPQTANSRVSLKDRCRLPTWLRATPALKPPASAAATNRGYAWRRLDSQLTPRPSACPSATLGLPSAGEGCLRPTDYLGAELSDCQGATRFVLPAPGLPGTARSRTFWMARWGGHLSSALA